MCMTGERVQNPNKFTKSYKNTTFVPSHYSSNIAKHTIDSYLSSNLSHPIKPLLLTSTQDQTSNT